MKKIFALLSCFAVTAMILFCGCNNKTDVELIPIQDEVFIFPSRLFVGATVDELAQLNPAGECIGAVNVFLMKKDGKNILFDAGVGGETSQMLPKLSEIGLKPEDIDAVLITHCHYDHIGGLTNPEAVFPNAKIYISAPEFKAYSEDTTQVAKDTPFSKMVAAYDGQIMTFEYEQPLLCGIIAHDASGHTPGHTIYEIGNTLVFGDLLHAREYQLPNPHICAAFDKDTTTAVEKRIYYYEYAAKNHKRVAASHLPNGGIIEDFATVQ